MIGRPIHALSGFAEVFRLGQEDVGNELLGVAIDERKPGALHVHHQPMPLLKPMQHIEKLDANLSGLPRLKRLGLFIALAKSSSKHLASDHHLIGWQRRRLGGVWKYVDQLHDEV